MTFQEKFFLCYIPGCDVINFEINFIFLIKPFFYMTKKSRQKFKYLEKENGFQGEIKSIFHHFKGDSVAKSCLRPDNESFYSFVHNSKIIRYLQEIEGFSKIPFGNSIKSFKSDKNVIHKVGSRGSLTWQCTCILFGIGSASLTKLLHHLKPLSR